MSPRLMLYRMELDDEFGEPYYVEVTIPEVVAWLREQGAVDEFEVVESPPRVGPHGEWEQQEPHIVSGKIEPARCLLPVGRYFVAALPLPERPDD